MELFGAVWNYLDLIHFLASIQFRTVPNGSELFIKSSVNIVQNGSETVPNYSSKAVSKI